jgi:hypothetical protein
MVEMMGDFGNRVLEAFAPPVPHRDSGRLRQVDEEEIINKLLMRKK